MRKDTCDRGWLGIALLLVGACSPPIAGAVGDPGKEDEPKPPTGVGPGQLPPGAGGPGPACGKQLEGPDIPCPDGAPPPSMPPPDAGAPPSVPPPPNGGVSVKVRAWGATFTGVYLKVGETATITATGRWRAFGGVEVGPEGRSPNYKGCPRGSLVARMAKFHQRTCIGAAGKITAKREGFVWLYQSEGWNAMQSTGEIDATITGGSMDTRWREGMTPLSLDPRLDPARIQAFESVCGPTKIPVLFEAENPNHPRVQAYVRDYFGGDPQAWISRAIVRGCALFYATPADFPKHFKDRQVRVVHSVSETDAWANRDRPQLRNHWDFRLNKTLAEITSMQPDYGPFGGPPVSIMHEVGHLLAPDGASGTLPKWLQEGYAETLPSNIGDDRTGFHNSIDNPESVRFGATFWWCDGNFGAPSFLDWIDEQHPGFLHALTKASMALNGGVAGRVDREAKVGWPGSDAVFRPITGRSFDDLWKGFADAYDFAEYKPGRPIEECMDPRE
jgi:hypothetical protein